MTFSLLVLKWRSQLSFSVSDLVFIFGFRILFELEHDGSEPADILDMLDAAGSLEVDVEVAKFGDPFPLRARNYFVNWGHEVLVFLAVESLRLGQLLIVTCVPEVVKFYEVPD